MSITYKYTCKSCGEEREHTREYSGGRPMKVCPDCNPRKKMKIVKTTIVTETK